GFRRLCGGRAAGHDEVDAAADQFANERGKAIAVPVGRAIFDLQVLALNIAALVQAAQQSVEIRLVAIQRYRLEDADTMDRRWLLRTRHERPRRRAPDKANELPSSHVIRQSQRPVCEYGRGSSPRAPLPSSG